MHLAIHPIREVAAVAAIKEGAYRVRVRIGGFPNGLGCDWPGGGGVFRHGAPEAPVLVIGGGNRGGVSHRAISHFQRANPAVTPTQYTFSVVHQAKNDISSTK
jgi:hypothetical protein